MLLFDTTSSLLSLDVTVV